MKKNHLNHALKSLIWFDEIRHALLTRVSGSLIRSLIIDNGLTQLDVTKYNSGLYCLKLTDQSNRISTTRFTIIK